MEKVGRSVRRVGGRGRGGGINIGCLGLGVLSNGGVGKGLFLGGGLAS